MNSCVSVAEWSKAPTRFGFLVFSRKLGARVQIPPGTHSFQVTAFVALSNGSLRPRPLRIKLRHRRQMTSSSHLGNEKEPTNQNIYKLTTLFDQFLAGWVLSHNRPLTLSDLSRTYKRINDTGNVDKFDNITGDDSLDTREKVQQVDLLVKVRVYFSLI